MYESLLYNLSVLLCILSVDDFGIWLMANRLVYLKVLRLYHA